MKYVLLLLVSIFTSGLLYSQQKTDIILQLRNQRITVQENVSVFNWEQFAATHTAVQGQRFAIAVFAATPGEVLRKQLINGGITLGDYIGNNTWQVAIWQAIDKSFLQSAGILAITDLPLQIKMDDRLLKAPLPAYAITRPGTIDVLVSVQKGLSVADARRQLAGTSFEVIVGPLYNYQLLMIRCPQSKLTALAALPFINFIQPISPADKKLNDELTNNARSNVLNAPISAGGENLQGKGVVIGIGDNADITSHVDLADRVIDRSGFIYLNHGTQMSGVAAGAGIKEALYKGVAPKATLVAQLFGGIYQNALKYVTDYNMVVTNNSYGSITGDCSYAGVYDLYSTVLDQQAFLMPKLLHVFAAGNDGSVTCGNYPVSYHTVLGGYQSSKNILSVGWGEKIPIASNAGSHGPTMDGRINPQITASGSEIRSTGINNSYVTDYGSSLSSPAVAGGAVLLVEKYRQLNGGADPASGLIKALLLNGATDIDNPGPDYKSGFGFLNLNRSVAMIKDNHFIQGNITPGATINHTITVPSGSSQVKVMVYWHDPSAAVFANATLVNDVDMVVTTPANAAVLPWILDPGAANVLALATRGIDKVNNQEQVTIDNPAAGNYTVQIKGTGINEGASQQYFIAYDFLPNAIDLTFPSIGDPMVGNDVVLIVWDAWDNSPNTFTLEYSIDNGASYTTISNAITGTQRYFQWTVPSVSVKNAKMRLMRNGTGLTDESNPFPIMPQANLTISATLCEGYMPIQWSAVPNATDYEVLVKRGPELVPVATTTATSFVLSGLSKDSVYWMTVRPVIDGAAGMRSTAVQLQPNQGACAGSISDNDLKLDSILMPTSGRKQTRLAITGNQLLVRIKNLDDMPVTGFQVKYSINGGPFVTSAVVATIPALGTYVHTFTGVDLTATGPYNVVGVVKNNTADVVPANDTLAAFIQQLPNDALVLPFVETFETATQDVVNKPLVGLPGLNRWDFARTTSLGRVRTFVNSGIALNGTKALTIDAAHFIQTGNLNYVTGTFNMQNYDTATGDIRLDFWWKDHGQFNNANNRIAIRGNDSAAWITAFNPDANKAMFNGTWQRSQSISISRLLKAAKQQFSPSLQVRIGQLGIISMADDSKNGGYTFDDVRLYVAANDVAVTGVVSPSQKNCALGSNAVVSVRVANNSGQTISNIPITLQVDGGTLTTETIASIAALDTATYTFSQTVNLSAVGNHSLNIYTGLATDTYKQNDSLLNYALINQPIITTFPYLQNFENGQGNWYAEGRNSSWEFGKPNSLKITKAASGNNAWKTSLRGTYNDDELSYLYSPCFDISALATPWLSVSMAMDIEQCGDFVCDQAWIEYSTNGGTSWVKLGQKGAGLNWYNRPGNNVWDSSGFIRWHSAGIAFPAGLSTVQLRVVINTDGALIKEGVAIDDIHIYDRQFEIYTGPSVPTPVTQPLTANTWNHFTSGGKVIADINPANNNLGSAGVQVFINKGGFDGVRYTNGQYLLDRSITVKPANTAQPDSTRVRYYFTDAETDTLVRATSCNGCAKPADAYGLGVTKYNDADDTKENGELADNVSGMYSFITAARVVKVPYDRGYYAEFKVKDFSEFWLNNGGITGNLPLPVLLSSFNAVKQNKEVLVQWATVNESNINRYEVEVARSNTAFNTRQFEVLQKQPARNATQSSYSYIDNEANKTGARYYRLKIVDNFGEVRYSEVKVVVFDSRSNWLVYPNPVRNVLQVVAQANAGNKIEVQLINTLGQVLISRTVNASGFPDKVQINVADMRLSAGVYVVKISSGDEVRQVRVVVE